MTCGTCGEGGIQPTEHQVEDIRSVQATHLCYVCDKMRGLRGSSTTFDLDGIPPVPSSNDLFGAVNRNQFNEDDFDGYNNYMAFKNHAKVRIRYYVQAHLHWFGYYPELMGVRTNPGRSTLVRWNKCGFPRFHVDGKWGDNSRTAYQSFLDDVSETTAWSSDNDVLEREDIDLIIQKCAEGFNRPGFDYSNDYWIRSRQENNFKRPFEFNRGNLSPPLVDSQLAELVEHDSSCEPKQNLPFSGATINVDFAPFESLPVNITWPVRTSSQHRWKLHYTGIDCTIGGSGKKFDGIREDGDRVHGGIDLLDNEGDPIVAVADGQIIGFDGMNAPTSTCFLCIYHPNLGSGFTINYGEVHHESLIRTGLMVGDEVHAGQVIGASGKMQVNSMLHFETYTGHKNRWSPARRPFGNLQERLNPTKLLLAIRQVEYDRQQFTLTQIEQLEALGMM